MPTENTDQITNTPEQDALLLDSQPTPAEPAANTAGSHEKSRSRIAMFFSKIFRAILALPSAIIEAIHSRSILRYSKAVGEEAAKKELDAANKEQKNFQTKQEALKRMNHVNEVAKNIVSRIEDPVGLDIVKLKCVAPNQGYDSPAVYQFNVTAANGEKYTLFANKEFLLIENNLCPDDIKVQVQEIMRQSQLNEKFSLTDPTGNRQEDNEPSYEPEDVQNDKEEVSESVEPPQGKISVEMEEIGNEHASVIVFRRGFNKDACQSILQQCADKQSLSGKEETVKDVMAILCSKEKSLPQADLEQNNKTAIMTGKILFEVRKIKDKSHEDKDVYLVRATNVSTGKTEKIKGAVWNFNSKFFRENLEKLVDSITPDINEREPEPVRNYEITDDKKILVVTQPSEDLDKDVSDIFASHPEIRTQMAKTSPAEKISSFLKVAESFLSDPASDYCDLEALCMVSGNACVKIIPFQDAKGKNVLSIFLGRVGDDPVLQHECLAVGGCAALQNMLMVAMRTEPEVFNDEVSKDAGMSFEQITPEDVFPDDPGEVFDHDDPDRDDSEEIEEDDVPEPDEEIIDGFVPVSDAR